MNSNDEPGIDALMSEEQEHNVVAEQITRNVSAVTAITSHIASHYAKEPLRTSQMTGAMYYEELLKLQNPTRFYGVARMPKPVTLQLLETLERTGTLRSPAYIESGEKLLTFLYIVSGSSSREAQERWQHSGDTITRTVHEVLAASQKFYPYFKDCIGAIDGPHVPEVPPADSTAPFRNRKGTLTQNVLVGCTFDMLIFFALIGWKGSAHDGHVLKDAMWRGFPVIEGKYYLGDAGYSLSSFVLTPYRGVRYHLKEWGRGPNSPQTKEEFFNLRHPTLRNAIERAVGTVKQKFPVLEDMARYLYPVQVKMMMAIFAIYNFIRLHGGDTSTESDFNCPQATHTTATQTRVTIVPQQPSREIILQRGCGSTTYLSELIVTEKQ